MKYGDSVRCTFKFDRPAGDSVVVCSVTGRGEYMAVAMATARLLMLEPDARISAVELVSVEHDFEIDMENDALNY